METEYIEAINPDGTRLRLEFLWQADRYAHRISLIDADGAVQRLLESIEGVTHDAWPPSPPLQSLTIETGADGRDVALLVGMAGTAHWSASIEATPAKAQLIFDIACRHAANPGPLGSRYRLLSESCRGLAIHAGVACVTRYEREVEIRPSDVSTTSGTARWRYTVCLSSLAPI